MQAELASEGVTDSEQPALIKRLAGAFAHPLELRDLFQRLHLPLRPAQAWIEYILTKPSVHYIAGTESANAFELFPARWCNTACIRVDVNSGEHLAHRITYSRQADTQLISMRRLHGKREGD